MTELLSLISNLTIAAIRGFPDSSALSLYMISSCSPLQFLLCFSAALVASLGINHIITLPVSIHRTRININTAPSSLRYHLLHSNLSHSCSCRSITLLFIASSFSYSPRSKTFNNHGPSSYATRSSNLVQQYLISPSFKAAFLRSVKLLQNQTPKDANPPASA
jgi:hypothetical protein